jgi:quercetin dioxygenase-like cupin family protein
MTKGLTKFANVFAGGIIRTAGVCLMLTFSASIACSADYNPSVTAKVLKKTTVTGNGERIAYPKTDRAEVTAMTVELAPGGQTGWHKHPVPVLAYVVSGHLTVDLEGGKTLSYGPGDAIIEVVDAWHNGKNNGAVPVQLAVFYLGVEGTVNVVKK